MTVAVAVAAAVAVIVIVIVILIVAVAQPAAEVEVAVVQPVCDECIYGHVMGRCGSCHSISMWSVSSSQVKQVSVGLEKSRHPALLAAAP